MTVRILFVLVLIMCSAFFSGTETAFACANVSRLKARVNDRGLLSDRAALFISEHYSSALSSILIGNNLVNTAASSIATVIVIAIFGGNQNYSWVSTVIMTILVLTFGEILPKVIAKRAPEVMARIFALPIVVIYWLFRPLVWIIDGIVKLVSKIWASQVSDGDAVSEDDLEKMLDIVEDEGILDEEQCDLLQNALNFDEVLAFEVVTPRVDMLAIDIHDSFSKNKEILLTSPFTRIPVYEDTPDKIIGILHLNRFLKAVVSSENEKISIRSLLSEPVFVHKTMPLDDVLDKMKELNRHMVVVLDEYGGTFGILTMEDVLEQLVGEIWDESDEIEEEFVCIDETHYEALGDMRIFDFFDELDIDVESDEEEFDDANVTLGGWATDILEGEVEEGSSFEFKNLLITVLEYDNNRIEKLGIEVIEKEEEQAEEEE